MKKILTLFILLFFLSASLNAMEPAEPPAGASKSGARLAPVDTYFLPREVKEFKNQLYQLLDGAQEEVLVAMYWLTDRDIIDKLISLKQKGINVQIVTDESMDKYYNVDEFVGVLIQNNITPYVLPINTVPEGIMHNKFIVIDKKRVLTGSANFTHTVLDISKDVERYNNENVIIIYPFKGASPTAEKFAEEFSRIKKEIIRVYIDFIASAPLNELRDWIKQASKDLYNKNEPDFLELYTKIYNKSNKHVQDKLKSFFEGPITREIQIPPLQYQEWEPASDYQRNILLEAGFRNREIDRMSYEEAYEEVGNILAKSKYRGGVRYRPY